MKTLFTATIITLMLSISPTHATEGVVPSDNDRPKNKEEFKKNLNGVFWGAIAGGATYLVCSAVDGTVQGVRWLFKPNPKKVEAKATERRHFADSVQAVTWAQDSIKYNKQIAEERAENARLLAKGRADSVARVEAETAKAAADAERDAAKEREKTAKQELADAAKLAVRVPTKGINPCTGQPWDTSMTGVWTFLYKGTVYVFADGATQIAGLCEYNPKDDPIAPVKRTVPSIEGKEQTSINLPG